MIGAYAPVEYGPLYKPGAGMSSDYGPDVQGVLWRRVSPKHVESSSFAGA
jgi:hypothetical protein